MLQIESTYPASCMKPASVNSMLKWQITITEQKVYKFKTCQDVKNRYTQHIIRQVKRPDFRSLIATWLWIASGTVCPHSSADSILTQDRIYWWPLAYMYVYKYCTRPASTREPETNFSAMKSQGNLKILCSLKICLSYVTLWQMTECGVSRWDMWMSVKNWRQQIATKTC